MCNGIALHGGVIPYCATFLTFHDYMRPSVPGALMKQRVIYIYTHDNVWLGEDGPTHQPMRTVEHALHDQCLGGWKPMRCLSRQRRGGLLSVAMMVRRPCLTRQGLPFWMITVLRKGLGAVECS